MLISVQGTILDTKNIYYIDPIEERTGDGYFFGYYFNIRSFNDSILTVLVDEDYAVNTTEEHEKFNRYFGNRDEKYKEQFHRKAKIALEKLRNKIISYWQSDQPDIPILELD